MISIPYPPPSTGWSWWGGSGWGSGVEDVDRFDETGIVMSTTAGTLVVTGEDLHIGKLSLDGGELHVDGRIDSVTYEDQGQSRGGFFSRLFG